MNISERMNNIFHKAGFHIYRYPNDNLRRKLQLMAEYQINKILDVGANEGQFAKDMRKLGFKGEIVSFEPLSSAYAKLCANSRKDRKWAVHNCALGDEDTSGKINMAGNSYSSSILEMLETHINAAPESRYVGKEDVIIKRLDSLFEQFFCDNDNIMLKIDTQGYEKHVIDGAGNSLKKIRLVQLEASLVPLYHGELLLAEMIQYLEHKDFSLIAIESEFENPLNHHLLQVNCIFLNNAAQ
ncbi:MAG TPA: FkbM family methyltransferase [bacterium]|nr:FkbM family methyltransferase [bacterium]